MKKFILLLLSILFITAFGFAQPRPNLNGLRIMIDPGHGGYNSTDRQTTIPGISVAGQNNTYFWESVGNWDKANYLKPMLEALGATVNLTREHNNYGQSGTETLPTLVTRRTLANTWNANWFHSIHSNGGQGTETYTLMLVRQNWNGINNYQTCVTDNTPTWPEAMTMSGYMGNNLLAYIRVTSIFQPPAALDFNFYGACRRATSPAGTTAVQGYNLGVLNGTNMPAELSEGSFHSTQPETRRLMNTEYRKLEAYALRDAMIRYWQVTTPITTGIIEGIVTDPVKPANAQGVNYVKMTLNPINRVYNGDHYSNGFYMFDNVPPGTYTLVFEADGYGTSTQSVTVAAGAVRRYDITAIDLVPPVVLTSTLANGSAISLGNTSFDLTFSKNMNTASVQTNLSFSPAATSVNFVWSNNNTTVRVTPVLSSGTSYTMTIGTNAADAGGTRMAQPYTRNFRTMTTEEDRPTIITSYPQDNDINFPAVGPINFTFSRLMNESTLQGAIFLRRGDNIDVPKQLAINTVDDKTVVTLKSNEDLNPNTDYTVVITTAARDLSLNNSMGSEYSFTFSTSDKVYVRPTIIDNFESGANWYSLTTGSSGQNAGLLAGTSSAVATNIFYPWGTNASSRRINYVWNPDAASHFIRDYCSASGTGSTPSVEVNPSTRLQTYVFGDGSGNMVRFCIRDDINGVGGFLANSYVAIDWYGWRLLEWDFATDPGARALTDVGVPPANGTIRIDSYNWTLGGATTGTVYFDELRFIEVETFSGVPAISVSTTNIDFEDVEINFTKPQTITIRNTGNVNLVIDDMSIAGDGFSLQNVSLPITIGAGGSRNITVQFAPTVVGPHSGIVTIRHNATGSPHTVTLTGNAFELPVIVINPTQHDFNDVLFAAPISQDITIQNTGNVNLIINNISIDGDGFNLLNASTPMTIAAGASNTFTVQFAPTVEGPHSAIVTLTHNARGGSSNIPLTGYGVEFAEPRIVIQPLSINFENVPILTSINRDITIRNTGLATLDISAIDIHGDGFILPKGETQLNILPGESYTLTVQFAPTEAINYPATITLSHNAAGGSSTINLMGAGILVPEIVVPMEYDFGGVLVSDSRSHEIIIQNSGTGDLEISNISITGGVFTLAQGETSLVIPPHSNYILTVLFTPIGDEAYSGTITLLHNAEGSPNTIALSGVGVLTTEPNISIIPDPLDFGYVMINTSITQDINIRNTGAGNLEMSSIIIEGDGFIILSGGSPEILEPGEHHIIKVQFSPTALSTYSGTITIEHNVPDVETSVIELIGIGGAPDIAVTPSTLDFGTVVIGTPGNLNVTIQNTGTAELIISHIELTGNEYFHLPNHETTLTIHVGQRYTLAVQFAPVIRGTYSATLALSHNVDDGGVNTIELLARAIQPGTAEITITPTPLNFGNSLINTWYTKNIAIENKGTADLDISDISISGSGFSLLNITTPLTILANGGRRTVAVQFYPAAVRDYSGIVTLKHDMGESTVEVKGAGALQTYPGITIDPTATLAFGNLTILSSKTQNMIIENNGTADLVISEIDISGAGFSLVSQELTITISPDSTYELSVQFLPTVVGPHSGTVTLSHNAGSPINVQLSGTGTPLPAPSILVNETTLEFGNVVLNTSGNQNITVQNRGTADLLISEINIMGTGFTSKNEIPVTITAGGNGTITIQFLPTRPVSHLGILTLIHNDADVDPIEISLKGSGTAQAAPAISLSANTLDFGDVGLNTSSTKDITIQNTGSADLVISQASVTGTGFSLSGVTTPITIAAGGNRTIVVQFLPTTEGDRSGTLSLTHNATGSPSTVTIRGNGVRTISVNEPEDLMGDGSTFLFQSSPNPVRLGYDATIRYRLNTAGNINLTVYDVLGREVASLANEYKDSGLYTISFSTKGLPSGVYFYRLRAAGYEGLKKMVVIR